MVSYKKQIKISQFFIKFKMKIHEIIKTNAAIKNMNALYRVRFNLLLFIMRCAPN